jgi:hypothetical protein
MFIGTGLDLLSIRAAADSSRHSTTQRDDTTVKSSRSKSAAVVSDAAPGTPGSGTLKQRTASKSGSLGA